MTHEKWVHGGSSWIWRAVGSFALWSVVLFCSFPGLSRSWIWFGQQRWSPVCPKTTSCLFPHSSLYLERKFSPPSLDWFDSLITPCCAKLLQADTAGGWRRDKPRTYKTSLHGMQ